MNVTPRQPAGAREFKSSGSGFAESAEQSIPGRVVEEPVVLAAHLERAAVAAQVGDAVMRITAVAMVRVDVPNAVDEDPSWVEKERRGLHPAKHRLVATPALAGLESNHRHT